MVKQETLKLKKPSKPHVIPEQVPVTEEEIKERLRIEQELAKLGISISLLDDTMGEHEDLDVLEAIILVNQGKKVPEDLKRRILQKKKTGAAKHESSKGFETRNFK